MNVGRARIMDWYQALYIYFCSPPLVSWFALVSRCAKCCVHLTLLIKRLLYRLRSPLYPRYWSALIYVKCCLKWFGKTLKITLIIFFFCLFSTTEIISTSARVFATSAHQVQVKTAVVLDAASVISTCSYCDEVSAKLSSSVENIHANTTVTGYALSSIRQLVPNTGKYRSCRLFIIYLFATQN